MTLIWKQCHCLWVIGKVLKKLMKDISIYVESCSEAIGNIRTGILQVSSCFTFKFSLANTKKIRIITFKKCLERFTPPFWWCFLRITLSAPQASISAISRPKQHSGRPGCSCGCVSSSAMDHPPVRLDLLGSGFWAPGFGWFLLAFAGTFSRVLF